MRAQVKLDLKTSPAEMVLGQPLSLPGDLLNFQEYTGTPAQLLQRTRDAVSQFTPQADLPHPHPPGLQPPQGHQVCLHQERRI